MTTDEKYMYRCLQLAEYGAGYVAPNPRVGAVLVANGKIIGEGYHAIFGQGHAEVNAFASVKEPELLPVATLYVSLEPCSHYGKTPPCADLIIRKGVRRVVIGCQDPYEKVAGRGIRMLREAGIEVVVGVLEEACQELIRRFMTYQLQKRPYVTLKWAQSADGMMDVYREDGRAVRISTPLSMMAVHRQRSLNQAILVGRRTAELDNPSLTVREWAGKHPLRVVFDRRLTLPSHLHLFDGNVPTLVLTEQATGPDRRGVTYVQIDYQRPALPQLMHLLYERHIQSLMVEGGSVLLQSFIDEGWWDEIYIEHGTCYLKEGVRGPRLPEGYISRYRLRDGHVIEHLCKSPFSISVTNCCFGDV